MNVVSENGTCEVNGARRADNHRLLKFLFLELPEDRAKLGRTSHLTGCGYPSHQCLSQMPTPRNRFMWQGDSKQFVQFHSPLVFARQHPFLADTIARFDQRSIP